jgi:hypothetical protein
MQQEGAQRPARRGRNADLLVTGVPPLHLEPGPPQRIILPPCGHDPLAKPGTDPPDGSLLARNEGSQLNRAQKARWGFAHFNLARRKRGAGPATGTKRTPFNAGQIGRQRHRHEPAKLSEVDLLCLLNCTPWCEGHPIFGMRPAFGPIVRFKAENPPIPPFFGSISWKQTLSLTCLME